VEAIPSKVVVVPGFHVEMQEFQTTAGAQISRGVIPGCVNVVGGFGEGLRWPVVLCGACVPSPALGKPINVMMWFRMNILYRWSSWRTAAQCCDS